MMKIMKFVCVMKSIDLGTKIKFNRNQRPLTAGLK